MSKSIQFRALELHGNKMWQFSEIKKALEFMVQYHMTDLVLHQNDIIQKIVFPRSWFDENILWQDSPVRRGINEIYNNRIYFSTLLKMAQKRNISVWLEVKELECPDEVIEMYPGLIKNGILCPSEPVWLDFIMDKTRELVEDFPEIKGIIVSPGSPEGRTSMAQNKCMCPICQKTNLEDWYYNLIMSMFYPLHEAGRSLMVREFAYKPIHRDSLVAAIERTPAEVGICIKNTPHDFFPTFPHNSAIKDFNDRELWVEYDVYGQFYGWGLVPCVVLEDLRERIEFGIENNVSGYIFRTQWERVNDLSCFDTFNLINLIGAAKFTYDKETSEQDICLSWLKEKNYLTNEELTPSELTSITNWLLKTWQVIRKTLFIRDHVLAYSSMFPKSVDNAWWIIKTKYSLIRWLPEKEEDLKMNKENINAIWKEKDEALDTLTELEDQLKNQEIVPLEKLRKELLDIMPFYRRYVTGFHLIAKAIVLGKIISGNQKDLQQEYLLDIKNTLEKLEKYLGVLHDWERNSELPHQYYLLMNWRYIDQLITDLKRNFHAFTNSETDNG